MTLIFDRYHELRDLPHCTEFAALDVRLGPRFGWRPAIIYRRTDVPVPPPGSPAAMRPQDYPAPEPVGLELCIQGPFPCWLNRPSPILRAPDSLAAGALDWWMVYGAPYGHFDGVKFPGWHRLDYVTFRPNPPDFCYEPGNVHPVQFSGFGALQFDVMEWVK